MEKESEKTTACYVLLLIFATILTFLFLSSITDDIKELIFILFILGWIAVGIMTIYYIITTQHSRAIQFKEISGDAIKKLTEVLSPESLELLRNTILNEEIEDIDSGTPEYRNLRKKYINFCLTIAGMKEIRGGKSDLLHKPSSIIEDLSQLGLNPANWIIHSKYKDLTFLTTKADSIAPNNPTHPFRLAEEVRRDAQRVYDKTFPR